MSKQKRSKDWSVPPLRLFIIKGSFFTADDGAALDTDVWSKLPEELVWEVLRFVPAAAHFRWQSVSRKWRQVLTSAKFRNTLMAASASGQSKEQQPPVVAWVHKWPGVFVEHHMRRNKLKVVELDLSSLVPSWFWKSNSYMVEAAANGLVCISNDSIEGHGEYDNEESRFCLLKPLTCTCKVLPQMQVPSKWWLRTVCLQPTPMATNVTIFSFKRDSPIEAREAHVATYNLVAGGGRDFLGCRSIKGIRSSEDRPSPVVALCGGETYLYDDNCQVRVLVPGPAGRLVDTAVLDSPSVALMDASLYPDRECCEVSLVVHRGALFYMQGLVCASPYRLSRMRGVDVVFAIWRLARERLEWELVTRLNMEELGRLTGLDPECIERSDHVICNWSATPCGVRELLFNEVTVDSRLFKLGFNLDTGEWELHLREQNSNDNTALVELRPDVFV